MRNLWRDNRLWAVALLAVAALLVGVQHNRAIQRGAANPFAEAVMALVAPVQSALRSTGNFLSDFGYGVLHGRRLREENERLRQQIDALRSIQAAQEELRQENERLRRLLQFAQMKRMRPLTARVLAIQPSAYFHTLIVNCGQSEGVRPRMVAMTDKGLVGLVYLVTRHTAHILLITDPNASVGARVQRAESRAVGVCRGRGEDYLMLTFLSKDADVRPGDVVVTSGLGGVYPAGIPVGVVEQVMEQRQAGMREARIKPFVDVMRVEEVLLVRAEPTPQ
ncbi:MAG: rod shape-determining protein MreC [Armatimonadota bacterium]|nr:rod shape-determining protein MreC [Armatimonadota bacterium]